MAWLTDTFDRADESLDVSNGWVERNGGYDVVSNEAFLTTNPASSAVVAYNATGVASADYYAEAGCKYTATSGTSWIGVGGRRVNYSTADSDSYIALLNQGSGVLRLYKRISGAYTQLGEYAFTISDDVVYTVRLTMNGSTISVKLDGTERISVTDTSLTAQGDYCLHNGSGGSGTGYTWTTFTADALSTAHQIPSATLRLTSFAPLVYTNIVKSVPSSQISLTSFAPSATVVIQPIIKQVPSAFLTLTSFAPLEYKTIVKQIPSSAITITGFAPLDSGGVTEAAERPQAGGGVKHRPQKVVIIGRKRHVINSYSQLRYLLERYIAEQEQAVNALLPLPNKKQKIRVIQGKIDVAKIQLAQTVSADIERENEEILLMLVA